MQKKQKLLRELRLQSPEKADATRLMAIMAMGIKKGMEVEVTVEGENEEAAAAKMEEFFKANL